MRRVKFGSTEIDRIPSQLYLFSGGTPQGKREEGYGSGCESREQPVVSVDKTKRTNSLRFDDSGDDEAVVLGIFGALFAGILKYAGFKRGCDLIFGPDKDDQSDEKYHK